MCIKINYRGFLFILKNYPKLKRLKTPGLDWPRGHTSSEQLSSFSDVESTWLQFYGRSSLGFCCLFQPLIGGQTAWRRELELREMNWTSVSIQRARRLKNWECSHPPPNCILECSAEWCSSLSKRIRSPLFEISAHFSLWTSRPESTGLVS